MEPNLEEMVEWSDGERAEGICLPGFRTAKRLAQGSDNGLPIFLANCRAECQDRVG